MVGVTPRLLRFFARCFEGLVLTRQSYGVATCQFIVTEAGLFVLPDCDWHCMYCIHIVNESNSYSGGSTLNSKLVSKIQV